MIDPATGWFNFAELKTKRADIIANKIEQAWLNKYPWPTEIYTRPAEIILDRGREFMAEFSKMILKDYGIKKKPITSRNP